MSSRDPLARGFSPIGPEMPKPPSLLEELIGVLRSIGGQLPSLGNAVREVEEMQANPFAPALTFGQPWVQDSILPLLGGRQLAITGIPFPYNRVWTLGPGFGDEAGGAAMPLPFNRGLIMHSGEGSNPTNRSDYILAHELGHFARYADVNAGVRGKLDSLYEEQRRWWEENLTADRPYELKNKDEFFADAFETALDLLRGPWIERQMPDELLEGMLKERPQMGIVLDWLINEKGFANYPVVPVYKRVRGGKRGDEVEGRKR